MKKEFKLLPPMMPNFIRYEIPAGQRQDGIKIEGNTIPVRDPSKEEAEEYGELMKQAFIEHWNNLINKQ